MPAARSLVPGRIGRAILWAVAGTAALLLGLGALWIALPDPAPLAKENPRTTALIEQRKTEAREKRRRLRVLQSWVGLERISKRMVEAVVMSEDARFFGHEGLDWEAMRDAAKYDLAKGGFARGASTITQQLAKNLWFGTSKSLWRKLKEAVAASKIEHALSKRRVLALYLNVAEWGDGVFGVEAGARYRFGVSAAQLTTAQAVVMASLLPAPRRVDLTRPSRWLRGRAVRLLDRMRDEGRLDADEHLRASSELERILAGAAPTDDSGGEEPPEDEAPVAPQAAPAEPTPSASVAPAPSPQPAETLPPADTPPAPSDAPPQEQPPSASRPSGGEATTGEAR